MNRSDIRGLVRIYADELEASPKGLFTDAQLNTLINLSKDRVYLQLIDRLPQKFRYYKVFTITASKATYSVVTDLGITDFFQEEVMIWNRSDIRPWVIPGPISPEDRHQYESKGSDTGEPKAWMWESDGVISFAPMSDSTYTNGAKLYYFKTIPDLNHDTDNTAPNYAIPALPTVSHPLIALDVLRQWNIRDPETAQRIEEKYAAVFSDVYMVLTRKTAYAPERQASIIEATGYAADDYGTVGKEG